MNIISWFGSYLRWYLMPLRGNDRLLTARFSVLRCRSCFGSKNLFKIRELFTAWLRGRGAGDFSLSSQEEDRWQPGFDGGAKLTWSTKIRFGLVNSPAPLLCGHLQTGSSAQSVAWSMRRQGWRCWCWRCPGGSGCPAASKSPVSFGSSWCSPPHQQCSHASVLLRQQCTLCTLLIRNINQKLTKVVFLGRRTTFTLKIFNLPPNGGGYLYGKSRLKGFWYLFPYLKIWVSTSPPTSNVGILYCMYSILLWFQSKF